MIKLIFVEWTIIVYDVAIHDSLKGAACCCCSNTHFFLVHTPSFQEYVIYSIELSVITWNQIIYPVTHFDQLKFKKANEKDCGLEV